MRTRELIVQSPQIYLQAQATRESPPPSATQRFLQDLGALGGIARRAHRTLEGRLLAQLQESELQRSHRRVRARERRGATPGAALRTGDCDHARRRHPHGDPALARARPRQPQDLPGAWGSRATRCAGSSSSGSATVPPLVRAELAEPWREQILELYARYEGHLGRVHDALTDLGAAVSYPALTAFCRRHGIGSCPAAAGGALPVRPGPGDAARHQPSQRASSMRPACGCRPPRWFCAYSRMIFFQHYPRFTRFECKAFLAAGHRLLPRLRRPLHGG